MLIGHGRRIDDKKYITMKDGEICINNLNKKEVKCCGFGCYVGDDNCVIPQCYALISMTNKLKELFDSDSCPCASVCVFSGPVNL